MGPRKRLGESSAAGQPGKGPHAGRPSLPDGVAGIVAAFRLEGADREAAVQRWTVDCQPLLETALRLWGRCPEDAHLLAVGLVEEVYLNIDGGGTIHREVPWLSGTVANLWRGHCRARMREREREREIVLRESALQLAPTPAQTVADLEQLEWEKGRVTLACALLPMPYGHVVAWRVNEGLTSRAISVRLNKYRPEGRPPVGCRQVERLLQVGTMMVRDQMAGVDLHATHRQKFLPGKNPWIRSRLPPLAPQI